MSEHSQLETPASENPELREPDRELWRLWREGQRPDVRRFLAGAGDLALHQVAAVLAVDQRERWQSGERVPAEVYLQEHPTLQADVEKALELVYGEFLLREQLRETPAAEEFLQRFPQYAERLRQQLDLHRALTSSRFDSDDDSARGQETIRSPGRAVDAANPAWPAPPASESAAATRSVSQPDKAAEPTRAEQPQRLRSLPFSAPAERYTWPGLVGPGRDAGPGNCTQRIAPGSRRLPSPSGSFP